MRFGQNVPVRAAGGAGRGEQDDGRGMTGEGTAGEVVVRYRSQAWRLAPGGGLSLGRSSSCDVVLPDDPYVSRHAARLQVDDGFVLVHNDSRTKPLVLRPPIGEDRVVDPGAATTSRPFGAFDLVIAGRGGIPIMVAVDLRAMLRQDHDPAGDPAAGDTRSPETVTTPVRFTTGQRRVLAALCEPLLTRSGQQAVPATYAEIGSRLDLRPAYVRNVVKSLRETLTGHGVPGLSGEEQGAAADDFRLPLARWAVHHGWVTRRDVEALGPQPATGTQERGTAG